MISWHTYTVEEVVRQLNTDISRGLGVREAQSRLAEHGPNELQAPRSVSPWSILLEQFKNVLIIILLAATAVSAFLGHGAEAVVITVIVLFAVILGFVQEYRAEKAMAALKKLAAPSATVVRNGQPETIGAEGLVPGDLVLLEAGSVVPADIRLTEAVQARIDEAALTGESVPVEKDSAALPEADLPIGDRHNMAYKGTLVTYGRGQGLVVATGMRTELGRIAALLQCQEEGRTPLQKRLAAFGQNLAYAVLAICAIVLVAGLLRGEPPLLMFLTAISLAVAAIPEALPAVITISLALGAKKLVKQRALIRKLPAVETLGSVTYTRLA